MSVAVFPDSLTKDRHPRHRAISLPSRLTPFARPILVLNTYTGRHFLVAFSAAILTIMGLVMLFDMVELVRRSAAAGVGFATLAGMALLKMPSMFNILLPFCVMLGAMVVFWRLSRSHELVVIRASGVSVWQFLAPVLAIAFGIGIINVMAVNPLAAALYSRYEHMQGQLIESRLGSPFTLSERGMWLREAHDDTRFVVRAEQVHQEDFTVAMSGISIFVFEGEDKFLRRIEARSGIIGARATTAKGARKLSDDNVYVLKDVWIMQPGLPSVHHDSLEMPSSLSLDRIQQNFASPETMSFWRLPIFIRFFEKAGFSALKHRLHFLSLVASPLLLCAMVLVAAAFSMRPNQRSGGVLTRMVAGVIAGFVLFFFSKLIYKLGESASLPVWLAAWSPPVIIALLGLGALFHYEDG